MNAIPTIYRGIQYRSRLEAQWAAFFNLVGWRFEYEPLDFNGWIPDFVLLGKHPIYVEVKPLYYVEYFPSDIAAKIDASGCTEEVLIVGATLPLYQTFDDGYVKLGWLEEKYTFDDEEDKKRRDMTRGWWETAVLGFWEVAPQSLDFCHSYGIFISRMYGGYDGGHYGKAEGDVEVYVAQQWASAKKLVQWKPARRGVIPSEANQESRSFSKRL